MAALPAAYPQPLSRKMLRPESQPKPLPEFNLLWLWVHWLKPSWAYCHTEWSKSDKERQASYGIVYCGIYKIWYKRTYLQNRNRNIDVENKFMVIRGKGGGGMIWGFGIDIYTLVYMKEITNKDLLYSTENATQYSVMVNMGGNFNKKE